MNAIPEMTDVFRFMELRAPFSPEAKALRQNYIRDDFVGFCDDKPCRIDADLQSADSPSAIGKLVYEQVFCGRDTGNSEKNLSNLIRLLLGLLKPYQPLCPGQNPTGLDETVGLLSIFEMERRAHFEDAGSYYLLPERLEQIEGLKLFPELRRAFDVMERARRNFNLPKLVKELETIFNGRTLHEVVFQNGVYADEFRAAKRTLFDTLYLLYIMRRRASVNLEDAIDGLRVLHTIEALAVDGLIGTWKAGPLSQSDRLLRTMLEALFPELQGWNGLDVLPSLPLIQTKADFDAYFTAIPVIHPIFARLHGYKRPFNDLKPIGIGDLKVVKQWLIAYQPGEIAHIENVLKGETKDRTHRRLEKTEESFSFSSDSTQESQKDTQTTDRFELKREVENVVKTELSVGANANVTYNNGVVIANVGASFSYKRDATETNKASGTFSQETLAKAMERVQTRTTEQRSVTKLFETEETNKHGFDNVKGKGHVSGIYRWLDKKYKAQLFNYGKRMMFEFLIPEPAAFFVESRLRAFEATLECPQPPKLPVLKTVVLNFNPSDIDETKFQDLRQRYDLAEFSFPERTRQVAFINPATGEDFFQEQGVAGGSLWYAKTYACRLNAKGYDLSKLTITGYMEYQGKNETNPKELNTLEVYIDGNQIVRNQNEASQWWQWNPGTEFTPGTLILLDSDDVALTIGFWDIGRYHLSFYAELAVGQETLLKWQTQVFNKVQAIEQQTLDKTNQEMQLAYNTQMATYRNRLAELKATSVNDLIHGQSEAFNREIILTELKKHCLTMLTKEFDADASDDLIGKIAGLLEVSDNFTFRKLKVTEDLVANTTTCSFEVKSETIDYPSIALDQAKSKGRFIQFLEQAFEWQQLAYIFYPYFWATRPKWIEMMNHSDDTDPNMSTFLQAGSVKVLIAVTTAYEDAVLHFLATREPWEGGPAPVIGDPLFIPLYEELRKRQDDLYNAVSEGKPWTFVLPTSLVYLEDSGTTLPTFPDIPN